MKKSTSRAVLFALAALIGVPAVVLAYIGAADLLYSKPMAPMLARLNAPLPVFPECRLIREEDRLGTPMPNGIGSFGERYSLYWGRRLLLDASGVFIPESMASRRSEFLRTKASAICNFYRSHLESCGCRFGGSGFLPSTQSHLRADPELGAAVWPGSASDHLEQSMLGRTTASLIVYEQAEIDGRWIIWVDLWLREDGFTDTSGSARSGSSSDEKPKPSPQQVWLTYPDPVSQMHLANGYAYLFDVTPLDGNPDAVLRFFLERISLDSITQFLERHSYYESVGEYNLKRRHFLTRIAQLQGLDEEDVSDLIETAKQEENTDTLCVAIWALSNISQQARAAAAFADIPDQRAVRLPAMRLLQTVSNPTDGEDTMQLRRSLVEAIERCADLTFTGYDGSKAKTQEVVEVTRKWLADNACWVGLPAM